MKKVTSILLVGIMFISCRMILFDTDDVDNIVPKKDREQTILEGDRVNGDIFSDDSKVTLYETSIALINEGASEKAIEGLSQLLDILDSEDALYNGVVSNMGYAYYQLKDYDNAVVYFSKRTQSDYVIIEKHFMKKHLFALYKTEDYEGCIELAKNYLVAYKDTTLQIMAYDMMVNVSIETGKFDEALEANQLIIELDPDNVLHKIQTAYIYQYVHGYDFGKAYLMELNKTYPDNETLKRLIENE